MRLGTMVVHLMDGFLYLLKNIINTLNELQDSQIALYTKDTCLSLTFTFSCFLIYNIFIDNDNHEKMYLNEFSNYYNQKQKINLQIDGVFLFFSYLRT